MELSVQVEKPSSILRKLTIRVPAKEVKNQFDQGLLEVQKTAKLKGFRPGQAPLSVIKGFYGDDVRHRVYHHLIDESLDQALHEQKIRTVGRPKIDADVSSAQTSHENHDHHEHEHDHHEHDHSHHTLKEEEDLTFTATVEVFPEIEVKNYLGLKLQKEKVEVTEKEGEAVLERMRNSHAQLVPATGGLVLEDGTQSSRPIQKGDYVDLKFEGGLVIDGKVHLQKNMTGEHLLEVGSNDFIPGFEEQLIGMRQGETKTFRITFPADYGDKETAGKEAEFTVTPNEIKVKSLPELNDDFAKLIGQESLAEARKQIHHYLTQQKTQQAEQKVKGELVKILIENHPFEMPQSLIESQTAILKNDWKEDLEKQGFGPDVVSQMLERERDALRKKAESQVRASLLLEAIAEKEKISVDSKELDAQMQKIADHNKVELEKVKDFYVKNPDRKLDLLFSLRQEQSVRFLLDKATIKSVAPVEEK